VIPDALGVAEHEAPGRLQGVVKHGQQPPLQRGVHVDQHIATAYQVEMRERRIARQILPCEDAHVAERLAHLIPAIGLREKSTEPRV
jgi:hypothetical protein